MLYLAGGYPGLYFPLEQLAPGLPPPEPATAHLEIPMRVVTASEWPVTIYAGPEILMGIAPMVLVPMTQGLADRAVVIMRMTTRSVTEIVSHLAVLTIPMVVVTEHAAAGTIHSAPTIPLSLHPTYDVPLHLTPQIPIPLQITPVSTLERN